MSSSWRSVQSSRARTKVAALQPRERRRHALVVVGRRRTRRSRASSEPGRAARGLCRDRTARRSTAARRASCSRDTTRVRATGRRGDGVRTPWSRCPTRSPRDRGRRRDLSDEGASPTDQARADGARSSRRRRSRACAARFSWRGPRRERWPCTGRYSHVKVSAVVVSHGHAAELGRRFGTGSQVDETLVIGTFLTRAPCAGPRPAFWRKIRGR